MAKEIQSPKYLTGQNTYATIRAAAGTIWNGSSLVTINASNWASSYGVTLTEESTSGYYSGTFPATLAAGLYTVDFFLRAGGSPASTDTCFGTQLVDWSGTADRGIASFVDSNNRVDVGKVLGTAQTAGDLAALLATLAAYVDTEIAAIKAKTDNLPSDPADASDIAASFSSISSTLSTIASYIDTEVAAIKAKTDLLPASPAATGDIPTAAQNADKLLGRNIAGGADGTRTVQDALRFLRNKWTRSSTTLTVYAEDDSTPAWTSTLVAGASLDPVASSDPT